MSPRSPLAGRPSRRAAARYQPSLDLQVGQFSDAGHLRKNNEDWLGTFQHEEPQVLEQKGALFLVADGMGGHQGGDLASRYAVDQVIRKYMTHPSSNVESALRESIQGANAGRFDLARERDGRARWGTTIVAAVIRSDQLWIANVGDSRAYLLQKGKLRQLSQDHTWDARLNVPSSRKWIGSHLITRALGLKPRVEVDVYRPVALNAGDRLLLCSDGLTTLLPDSEIRVILSRYPPQAAAETLVAAANEQGGPDNVSAIVVRVAGRRRGTTTPSTDDLLERLTAPSALRRKAEDLVRVLPGGPGRWRQPALVVAVVIVALALIVLGFVLGSIPGLLR